MKHNVSLVAYYGEKDSELARQITTIQAIASEMLSSDFHPRPLKTVHATIIGLESVSDASVERVATLLNYIKRAFGAGITLQFGGFDDRDYPISSRGRRLYSRAFEISGRDAIMIGWPVVRNGQEIRPTAFLEEVRRECGWRGFRHKYHNDPLAKDADCYMSVGEFNMAHTNEAPVQECEQKVRDFLCMHCVRVPLKLEDLSLVLYRDRSLPANSTETYSINNLSAFLQALTLQKEEINLRKTL
jgi:hypothetical protein